ncbi:MAG: HDOD domain-containing protein [Pirellulales bacterium]
MTAPVQPLNLSKLLAGHQLPALPQSAIAVMEVSKNPQNGPAEYGAAIEADPGLTAQVLKFVNSSYFGFGREVRSVKHAVGLVGGRTIKNFVLWTAVFSVMPNPKSGPFDLKCLRQDSLRRGLLARASASDSAPRLRRAVRRRVVARYGYSDLGQSAAARIRRAHGSP